MKNKLFIAIAIFVIWQNYKAEAQCTQPSNNASLGGYLGWSTANPLDIQAGTTARIRLQANGVGIFTNPTARLDINGNLRIRTVNNNNSLTRVLVVTPQGGVFWRNYNTFGNLIACSGSTGA